MGGEDAGLGGGFSKFSVTPFINTDQLQLQEANIQLDVVSQLFLPMPMCT